MVCNSWINHSPEHGIKNRHDIPTLFCEPYIDHGFRPIHQSWSYYLKSLFFAHNELLNTWTHLLGAAYVAYDFYRFHSNINDVNTVPLITGFFCSFIMYVFSSGAHLFHPKSEAIHIGAFCLDYAGIALYGYGGGLIHFYHFSSADFYHRYKDLFCPVLCMVAWVAFIVNALGKCKYHGHSFHFRRLTQVSAVLMLYSVLMSPIFYRMFLHLNGSLEFPSIYYHLAQMAAFFASGVFYVSSFPQKFCRGVFDIVGASHQIFHILVVIMTYFQYQAVMVEYSHGTLRSPEHISGYFCLDVVALLFSKVVVVLLIVRRLS